MFYIMRYPKILIENSIIFFETNIFAVVGDLWNKKNLSISQYRSYSGNNLTLVGVSPPNDL